MSGGRHRSLRRAAVWALAVTAMLAVAVPALACPVCFGESDSPIVEGAERSILFMIGVTYTVIGSGVAAFVVLRRRSRQASSIGTKEL